MAWLWLLVGFALGVTAERFILDRKFIRQITALGEMLNELNRKDGTH